MDAAVFLGGGAAFLIDLDDYFALSEEGQAGWVTVHCRVDVSVGIQVGLSEWLEGVSMGYKVLEDAQLDLADARMDTDVWGGLSVAAGVQFVLFGQDSEGQWQGPTIETDEWEPKFGPEIGSISIPFGVVEVRREVIDDIFTAVTPPFGRGQMLPLHLIASPAAHRLLDLFLRGELGGRLATPEDYVGGRSLSADFELSDLSFNHPQPFLPGESILYSFVVKNLGRAMGSGELWVSVDDELVFQSPGPQLLDPFPETSATAMASWSLPTDLSVGRHSLRVEVRNVVPADDRPANDVLTSAIVIEEASRLPTASIVSITPNPAVQGIDTVAFVGRGDDPDDLGTGPEVTGYRWLSDVGTVEGMAQLYPGDLTGFGLDSSFSIDASRLKPGHHHISLQVKDNDGEVSEYAEATLEVIPEMPAAGHDLELNFLATEPVSVVPVNASIDVDVTVRNVGVVTETSFLVHYFLKNANGEFLDTDSYSHSGSLDPNHTQSPPTMTLTAPEGYEGAATVEVIISPPADEDFSNNSDVKSLFVGDLPVYDGYYGGSWTMVSGDATQPEEAGYRLEELFVGDFGGTVGAAVRISRLSDGQIVENAQTVIPQYCLRHFDAGKLAVAYYGPSLIAGTWRYGVGIFVANAEQFSMDDKHLTVQEGGLAEYHVRRASRSSTTCNPVNDAYVVNDCDEGSLIRSWGAHSVRDGDDNTLHRFMVTPPPGSAGHYEFWLANCWAFSPNAPATGRFGNSAAVRLTLTVLPPNRPPDTSIAGPCGDVIEQDTIGFSLSGQDDRDAAGVLEFKYRLDDGPWSEYSTQANVLLAPLGEGNHTLEAVARDTGRASDESPASCEFSVDLEHLPEVPAHLYPIPGQQDVPLDATLIASAFSDPDPDSGFSRSRFQIVADGGDFGSPLWDSGEMNPPAAFTQLPNDLLEPDVKYCWRTFYRDDSGLWSAPSAPTCFTTASGDTDPPTVVVNQASGQADPTSESPINFTVVFSEAVVGFEDADVLVGGTAGATMAEVTGDGTTYNVAVTGMSGSGTVTVSIPADVARDAAGNGNLASTSTDNTVEYEAPAEFSLGGEYVPEGFRLYIQGAGNSICRLECSRDLKGWVECGQVQADGTTVTFLDPSKPDIDIRRMFYRARLADDGPRQGVICIGPDLGEVVAPGEVFRIVWREGKLLEPQWEVLIEVGGAAGLQIPVSPVDAGDGYWYSDWTVPEDMVGCECRLAVRDGTSGAEGQSAKFLIQVKEHVVSIERTWTYAAVDGVSLLSLGTELDAALRYQMYNVVSPGGEIDQLFLAADWKVLADIYHGHPGACPGVLADWSQSGISLAGLPPGVHTLYVVRTAATSISAGRAHYENEHGGWRVAVGQIVVGFDGGGVLLHYPFEEGAGMLVSDASGHGNDGALVNGPAYVPGGVEGAYSLRFDGVDDRIDAPAGVVSGLADRSYDLWLKTTVAGGGLFRVDQWGGCCPGDYLVLNADGTLTGHHFSGGDISVQSASAVADGQWHHVALVLSSTEGAGLWVDGVEEARDATGAVPYSGNHFTIGCENSGNVPNFGNFFAGQIDEFWVSRPEAP